MYSIAAPEHESVQIETVRLNQESVERDGLSWAIFSWNGFGILIQDMQKVFDWWGQDENCSSEFVPWLGVTKSRVKKWEVLARQNYTDYN